MFRKAIFAVVLLLGVGCGLLSAWNDDWGLRIVMMSVGALFGGTIGAGLSQVGARRRRVPNEADEEAEVIPSELGTSSRDVAANFWRDEGFMPFMKPSRPEHGLHMLDADKDDSVIPISSERS